MLRVGLTGGIGSGKSSVAARLAEHGAVVIDADALARAVVEPGTEGLAEVVAAFGRGVLTEDGALDRPALAAIVFGDEEKRRRLEAITHPRVGQLMMERLAAAEAAQAPVLVVDVPLLVETGQQAGYDVVVVVEAPRSLRLGRLEGRGLPREQALARMDAQASDADRRAVADYVVDNAGDLDALNRSVDGLWVELLARTG